MARFLHSGDWQLGITRHFLDDDAQARFAEARFDAVRALGDVARREGCAFLVVCGDVFESSHVDRRTVARALEALDAVPVPVYLLPGNHDPLGPASLYDRADFSKRAPAHVRVLRERGPIPVADSLELVAAPWPSKAPRRDLAAEAIADLAAAPPGVARVLAAHGGVDCLAPDRGDGAAISLDALGAALTDGRLHYAALGDRHSTTSVGPSGRVWYAGSPEPTDFTEVDPGAALVVDVDAHATRVRPVRLGTWRFERRGDIPVSDAADLDALAEWLTAFDRKERTILRLGLVGSLSLREHARLETLLDDARDRFASIEVFEPDTELSVLAEDDDFEGLDLNGFAASAADRLRAQAGRAGAGGEAARDALALLVRIAGRSA